MDESCKGEGKKLRLNIYGEIVCECDDGWSYKDGYCHQEILRKFYGKISLECSKNICPVGTLPWSERPGECIKVSNYASKGRSSCSLFLEKNDLGEEVLSCDLEDISFRNVPGSFRHKCRRGRIWSIFRRKCVSKFF